MQSINDTLSERNTEVIVVSTDPVEASRRLAKKMGFTFTMLSDPNFQLIDHFGLRHPKGDINGNDIARPAVYAMDQSGSIVWRALTQNWRVRIRPETILERTADFQ